MDKRQLLLDEAAVCRQLARDVTDPASISMFLERAAQLEGRAAELDAMRCAMGAPVSKRGMAIAEAARAELALKKGRRPASPRQRSRKSS